VRAAVVIVTWNSREHLPRALDDLAGQTRAPDRTIVVDNASTDGTPDLVRERYPWVELIEAGANLGFAAGNNLAVRAAGDCDAIVLLNPDAFPAPDWLEALERCADDHPDHAFFGSRMMSAQDPDEIDGSGDTYHVSGLALRRHHGLKLADAPAALEPAETFSACAGAALYRREAFLGVGGFDESFGTYMEDTDLALRLRLAGHRGRYVPDSVVLHVGSASAGTTGDYTLYHAHRNLVWTWAKGMPWPLALLYLPQHLALNVATVAWFSVRGHARPLLRAKRDAIRGLPRVLRERRRIQAGRRVGVWALRGLMTTGAGAAAGVVRRARRR
jgi:GT2 family glycosyltransferase